MCRYNANVNLFGIATIVAEFLPGGGVLPYWRVDPVSLIPGLEPQGQVIQVFNLFFLAYIVYFMVKEVADLKKRGWSYWNDYWSWGEWSIIAAALAATGLFVYREFLTWVSRL